MKNIFTILKRELSAYFNSAIAYIYLIVFIVINNSLFMARFFLDGKANMNAYFNILPMVLLVFIPVITMRLWAEDKKENTFEMLMTFPMRPIELVLGKFFASLIFYLLSLLSTITIPVILYMSGNPDLGAIIGGYAGALLQGMLFLSIGGFISGLTKEQIVAFVLTALSCFVIFFVGTDFMASFINNWVPGLGVFMKDYPGAAAHLISFDKGVIDLKDIVYFAAMSAVFLILNGFLFEGRLRPKAKVVFSLAVLICFAGAVVFNWLVHDLPFGRFDITENKIYTTSEASKKILKDLKVPVSVNLYITPLEKMPMAFKTLEPEITGKLDELRIISNNKLNFKVFHIEASRLLEQNQDAAAGNAQKEDSLEKTLQDKGIMPFQVQSVDKDEVGVKLIYSAITVAYKEKNEEILPRIFPQNIPDLEYILFSRIIKLTSEKKPKIVLFSPLRAKDIDFEMSRLLSNMGQPNAQYEDEYKSIVPLIIGNGYDAVRIALSKDDSSLEGANTLMVINPGDLNDRQLYEINKFLYQGGSVLIAAQGFEYSFQSISPSGLEIHPQKLNLGINKLIQKWGIKINEDILMDENNQIIEVTTGQRVGPFAVSMPVKVPNQIIIPSENMNKNMPFVSRLPALFYFWGSALDAAEDILKQANLKKTVMFSSGDKSWKLPYSGGALKKEDLTFPKSGSESKFTLGLMLEGQFSDTFIEQGIPAWPVKEAQLGAPPQNTIASAGKKESTMLNPKPGKLIVLGCSKMFYDQLLSSSSGNLNFFANIVDGLTLGNNIIQIRSKSYVSRELKKITDIQKAAYKFTAILLAPILLAVFAFIRIFIRKKEKQFYLQAAEK